MSKEFIATKQKGNSKWLLGVILSIALLLWMIPVVNGTVFAADEHSDEAVVAFTSDAHNGSNHKSAQRLSAWLDNELEEYGHIDCMGFCGDMGDGGASESSFWDYAQEVMGAVEGKGINAVYTTGNHEYYNGKFGTTTNAVAQKYTVDDEGFNGDNFRIYALGTASSTNDNYTTDQVTKLSNYLSSVTEDEPIFVISHFPLHVCGSRTTTNAEKVIDALNDAANADKEVIFLWGHNHTMMDPMYDQIEAPGSSLNYAGSSTKEIEFFYAPAGCMSDSDYNNMSASVIGKGLVVTVDDDDDSLEFAYHNENGDDVTERVYRYEKTDSLEKGEKYVIGAAKDESNIYAIMKGSTSSWYSSSSNAKTTSLAEKTEGGTVYVETADANSVWTYTDDQYLLTGTNSYFYPGSSGVNISTSGRAITYEDGLISFPTSSSGTYYLTCDSSGSLSTTSSKANATEFNVYEQGDAVDDDDDPVDPSKIVVKYKGNGADSLVPGDLHEYQAGDEVTVAEAVSRTGYDFAGWTDGTNTYQPGEKFVINATTTLKAVWDAHSYSVHFDPGAEGVTGEMADQTFEYGTAQALTENAFALEGYVFNGWINDDNEKTYTNKQSVKDLTADDNGVVTLRALWKDQYTYYEEVEEITAGDNNKYIIAVDYDDELLAIGKTHTTKNNPTRERLNVEKGVELVTEGDKTYARTENPDAVAWTCVSSGSGSSTKYFFRDGNNWFYICSTGIKYQGSSTSNGRAVLYNADKTMSSVTTSSEYAIKYLADEELFGSVEGAANGDQVRLFRVTNYTPTPEPPGPTTYKVKYDANGATSGTAPTDSEKYEPGATVTVLGAEGLAKTGYAYDGWTDGTNTYQPGDQFEITANKTLKAVWKANSYTVKFVAGAKGATGEMADQAFEYGTAQALTANAFALKDYTFNGWKDADGNTYTDKQSVKDLTAEDGGVVTLTAQWKDQYTYYEEVNTITAGDNNKYIIAIDGANDSLLAIGKTHTRETNPTKEWMNVVKDVKLVTSGDKTYARTENTDAVWTSEVSGNNAYFHDGSNWFYICSDGIKYQGSSTSNGRAVIYNSDKTLSSKTTNSEFAVKYFDSEDKFGSIDVGVEGNKGTPVRLFRLTNDTPGPGPEPVDPVEEARTEALEAIAAAVSDDNLAKYGETQQAEIKKIADAFKEDVEDATTADDINALKGQFEQAMSVIPTKEDIANAKAAIDAAYDPDDYDGIRATKVAELAKAHKDAMDSAVTKTALDNEVAAFKDDIEDIATKNNFTVAKNMIESVRDDYDGVRATKVNELIAAHEAAMDNILTKTALADEILAFKDDIAGIATKTEVADAKAAIDSALEAYDGAQKDMATGLANVCKDNIDKAITKDEVSYELQAFKDSTKDIPTKDEVAAAKKLIDDEIAAILPNYKEEQQKELKELADKAKANIDSALSKDEVSSQVTGFKEAAKAVPTAAQIDDQIAKVKDTAVKNKKPKAGTKKITAKWTADATTFDGYKVSYRVKGKKKWKTKTVKGASKAKLVIKKMKTGKKYQTRVRGYKTINGQVYYGKYSKVKTTKKKVK